MKSKTISVVFACLLSTSTLATTLSEALVSTYQTNPELIAAREKLKATDESMFEAISGFLPKIEYTAKNTYAKRDTTDPSIMETLRGAKNEKVSPRVTQKNNQSDISITQNIFNGGRSMMAVQIAKYTIESGRADLISSEQKILLETIETYLNAIQAKQILEINKENVTFYEKKLIAVRQEAEAGIKKSSDLAAAQASRADANTKLAKAFGDYEEALAAYNKMVGIQADNLILGENLTKIPPNQIELLKLSLKNNPELTSLYYKQKAADLNIKSNVAALLPTVNVGSSFNKSWSNREGNAPSPYTNSKIIYGEVIVPIYNRGVEYSNTRKSSAEAANLKYLVKNAKATINQSVTQAWSKYTVAKESVISAQEAVKAGMAALDGAQQEHEEGVNTFTEVLNAQENLYQYQLSLTQAKQAFELSKYSMASLMGTLTAKSMALPTPIYNASANYDKVKAKLIGF